MSGTPEGPASLLAARRCPRALLDHCPGPGLGASPCYPGLMTLVLRRLGQNNFSSSDPHASLSLPQLAPQPPTPRFCSVSVRLAAVLWDSVLERSAPRPRSARPCGRVVDSIRCSLGREGIQRSPPASEAPAALGESPEKESPELPAWAAAVSAVDPGSWADWGITRFPTAQVLWPRCFECTGKDAAGALASSTHYCFVVR